VAAALSFLIIHADGTRSALCGLPLIHPTVLCFVASPSASKQASALSIAVYDFLRGALAYVHPSDASKSADPCVRKVVQAWVDTPNPAWMPNSEIILTNHSRPIGTLTALDPKTGEIVGTAELEDNAPEGAAADGKGHIFVNNERKNTIQVIDVKTWKATASWPLAPCEGPTGIAYDKASDRIFAGCNNTSVVVDPNSGKVLATIKNGTRVDAPGMGSLEKADLHSEWRTGQRYRRSPGLAR